MLPSPAPNSCVMYLVRHGATPNNLADPPLLQGRGLDLELSETGRWQAERTAKLLSLHKLAAIYSSPLIRARQTAAAIARPHTIAVQTIEALQEIDVGAWEGRSWKEISQTEPERYEQFMTDSARFGYRDGENMSQVIHRVQPALEAVVKGHLGGSVVVVAHNVVNRVYLATLLGIPLHQARIVHQDNCGISLVRYTEGRAKLLALNSVFHLAPEACADGAKNEA